MVWKTVRPNKRRQTKILSCENDGTSHQNLRTMPFSLQYKRFSCDLDKWFREVIVSCFISQWMKRSKHGLLVFPPKKILICKRHGSISQSCCSITVKAKYRLISRKFFGHEVFIPERSLNQPKATRVCIRSTNQSNPFISVRLLFLFVPAFSF